MYLNRLDEEINKLLRKKEKAKTYTDIKFNLEPSKDWRGNIQKKLVNGH